MSRAPYTFLLRRADGRGSIAFGRYATEALALNDRDVTFRSDHSITIAWVLDARGHLVGEPLLRDPPGAEPSEAERQS
jgi:hypothetical protein